MYNREPRLDVTSFIARALGKEMSSSGAVLAPLVPSDVVRPRDVLAEPAADLLRLDTVAEGVLFVLGLEVTVEGAAVRVGLTAELATEVLAVLALVASGGCHC